jgi:3D (Asp-Asp-Asp) domain-containing protein
VKIMDAGSYNGVYVVEDVMNKRYKNRIDILINPDDKHTKLYNIKIIKN